MCVSAVRQHPQETFDSLGRLTALTTCVSVEAVVATSTMIVASAAAGGGGQSWLVGKSPLDAESPGVHARPSFAPPLHRRVVGLQIGQGWMSVLHEPPPGQSTSPVQPKPAFEPPEQRPVSHPPTPPLQSPSKRQGVSAGSEKPLRHRPVSLTHVPPPQSAVLEPPLPGVGPPPHRRGSRSAVRKT